MCYNLISQLLAKVISATTIKKPRSAEKTHAYENELGEVLKDYQKIRRVHTLLSSALVESSSGGKSSFTPSPPPLNLPQGLHSQ